jgi:aerobic carbon-monoxide dehydrogenase small subunit
MKQQISLNLNGSVCELDCKTSDTLLQVLRNSLQLTGTKEGCASGDCGACSVIVNGSLLCSCLVLAVECDQAEVQTVEGLAAGETLHPLQQGFLQHAALQCGFCTPGLLMAAKALLEKNPSPTESEVRFHIAGNLCRCTGYDKIVRAILDVAEQMRNQDGGQV